MIQSFIVNVLCFYIYSIEFRCGLTFEIPDRELCLTQIPDLAPHVTYFGSVQCQCATVNTTGLVKFFCLHALAIGP